MLFSRWTLRAAAWPLMIAAAAGCRPQDEITQYEAALTAQRDALLARLRATYAANLQLAEELAQLQQQIADEIAKAEASKTAAK